ncbi:MAG: hypothetical protein LBG77_00785, partial [Dysgonamonadaceae bacterium]|nr:hypothetical protein [Dysgonamonadaceae bacterium]
MKKLLNNRKKGQYLKYLIYLCTTKGKRVYTSITILLFIVMQLYSQANMKYGVGALGNYSDVAEIEAALLPSAYKERVMHQNQNQHVLKAQAQPVFSAAALVNNSLAVGAITGIPEVTATGGASYRVPIEVPNGIAGLEPSVAISYNSQTGYGTVGYGWSLAASSVITRCGKTYYYDNAAEAPQLSNTDNLMLDGQRLILISGVNLVSGAKYRLEYDPFTDIAFKTVGSYMAFVVRTKDGRSREYGATANSNIETSSSVTLMWLLSKMTDKHGNTMTYEYEEVTGNGEFYLKKIQYAGNRSVQFTYEARNDKQKTYFAGTPVSNNRRLKNISTYINQ